jgi:Fur family ferric uptake transcriptional regulator
MLILTSLRHAGHTTAAEILKDVRESYPYVDISTVYRTLDVLKSMRLASETHLGGDEATFEWVGREPHHHLICHRCGEVTQLPHELLEQLGEQIAREVGFQADIDHFAIFGICEECRSDQSSEPARLSKKMGREHARS